MLTIQTLESLDVDGEEDWKLPQRFLWETATDTNNHDQVTRRAKLERILKKKKNTTTRGRGGYLRKLWQLIDSMRRRVAAGRPLMETDPAMVLILEYWQKKCEDMKQKKNTPITIPIPTPIPIPKSKKRTRAEMKRTPPKTGAQKARAPAKPRLSIPTTATISDHRPTHVLDRKRASFNNKKALTTSTANNKRPLRRRLELEDGSEDEDDVLNLDSDSDVSDSDETLWSDAEIAYQNMKKATRHYRRQIQLIQRRCLAKSR